MSQDKHEDDSENANAKVTANSAEVSLDATSADVVAEEKAAAEQTSRLGSFLPWKSDFYRKDAVSENSELAADPFLNMPRDDAPPADVPVVEAKETPSATNAEFDKTQLVEFVPPPPAEELIADKPAAAGGLDSLIESIDDGKVILRDDKRHPDEERNSALDRLRDMVSEADLSEEMETRRDSGDEPVTAAHDKSPLQIRIEEMLRVAQEMLESGSIEDAHHICLRAKTLAAESTQPLIFDDHTPDELLEEIDERRAASAQPSDQADGNLPTDSPTEPVEGIATIADAPNAERANPQEEYMIQRQVDELLLKARQRLENGLFDDAYRACQHAKALAGTSAAPLKFSHISPDELLAKIEKLQTESLPKQHVESSPIVSDRGVGKSLSAADFDPTRRHAPSAFRRDKSARSDAAGVARSHVDPQAEHTSVARPVQTDSPLPTLESTLPEMESLSTIPADQWEVADDEREFSTPLNNRETHKVSGSSKILRTSPTNLDLAATHASESADRSPRVVVNGSVRLNDGGVATTSLSVPGDEPSLEPSATPESTAAPSFLPHDWSQWDQEDDLSDERAISQAARRSGEPGVESIEGSASSHAADGLSTQLKSLEWGDDETTEIETVAHDSTQWKMMLGLSCLLAGLAAIGFLRQPRRHVPMAVPVEVPSARPAAEKSAS